MDEGPREVLAPPGITNGRLLRQRRYCLMHLHFAGHLLALAFYTISNTNGSSGVFLLTEQCSSVNSQCSQPRLLMPHIYMHGCQDDMLSFLNWIKVYASRTFDNFLFASAAGMSSFRELTFQNLVLWNIIFLRFWCPDVR